MIKFMNSFSNMAIGMTMNMIAFAYKRRSSPELLTPEVYCNQNKCKSWGS